MASKPFIRIVDIHRIHHEKAAYSARETLEALDAEEDRESVPEGNIRQRLGRSSKNRT